MSDAPGGEGWWQASDDKWYPPSERPEPPKPPPEAVRASPEGPEPAAVAGSEFTAEELADRRQARAATESDQTKRNQGIGCLVVIVIVGVLIAIGAMTGDNDNGGDGGSDDPGDLQYAA